MATEKINGVWHVSNKTSGGGGGGGTDPNAVHFTQQSLTAEQQTQARTNIGAGTYSKPTNGIPANDMEAGVIPAAVEANPTVPSGTTPTDLTGLKVGNGYYSVPQGGGSDPEAVKYTAQSLTDAQKTRARQNIGALTASDIPSPLMTYTPVGDVNPSIEPGGYVTRAEFDAVKDIVGNGISADSPVREPADYTLVNGYIGSDGVVHASTTYLHSDPIRLKEGETIFVISAGNGIAALSLTDENGSSYTPLNVNPGESGPYYYTYTAVADCYVAISGKYDSSFHTCADVQEATVQQYIDANDVGFADEVEEESPEYQLTTGMYLGANGKPGANAQYTYTTPIFLKTGDTLEFDFTGGQGVATLSQVLVEDNFYQPIRVDDANVASLTHVTYTAASDIWVAMTGKSIVAVKVTHAVPETAVLTLPEVLATLQANVKDVYEDLDYFELPIPQMARIDVTATGFSTSKAVPVDAVIEYNDVFHNVYFKRNVTLTAQGQSSMAYIEKNQTLDFADCEIKFGDWVAQDSFHLKAYYIDVFRGINNAMYNFAEEVIKMKGCRSNRVLESGSTTNSNGAGNFFTDFGTDALCHPDGFPVEVYLNGNYYGLFVLGLKKSRANYSMEKNNAAQILMDGVLGSGTFWNGTINWTQFEIRNPKGLVCMDGSAYDGEDPHELIDSSSASWDASNPNHVRSAAVKAYLVTLSQAKGVISAEATDEAKKAAFATTFDVDMFLVYYVVSQAIDNYDGFHKNWVWSLYSGKAAPNFYDMDSVFGRHFNGSYVFQTPNWGDVENYSDSNSISHLFVSLYSTEIAALYAELRAAGVITVDNIVGYLEAWVNRIGRAALKRNLDEWTEIPSYRPTAGSNYTDGTGTNKGMYDSVERVRLWCAGRIAYLDSKYGYNG